MQYKVRFVDFSRKQRIKHFLFNRNAPNAPYFNVYFFWREVMLAHFLERVKNVPQRLEIKKIR